MHLRSWINPNMQRNTTYSLSKQGGRVGAAGEKAQYADNKFR